MNILRTLLVVAALLVVEGYGNCGCLKCNKQLQVLTPPGASLKVIYRGDSCNCPVSLPYSVQLPVEALPPTTEFSYEYQIQPEKARPAPCHHVPESHSVQLQIPVEPPPPTYLVDLVAAPDRILISAPPSPMLPPGCPQPILEEVKAIESELADMNAFYYVPQPATYSCACSRYAKTVLPSGYLNPCLHFRTLWSIKWNIRQNILIPFRRYWYQSRKYYQRFPHNTNSRPKEKFSFRTKSQKFFLNSPRHQRNADISTFLRSGRSSTSKQDTFMSVRPKRAINWQVLASPPRYYPAYQQRNLLSLKGSPTAVIKGKGRPLCADCKRKQAVPTLIQKPKIKQKDELLKLKAKQKKAHVKLHFKAISKFLKNWLSKGNPLEPPEVQLPSGVQFFSQPEPRWFHEQSEKRHSKKKTLGRFKRAIGRRKKDENPLPYFTYPYEDNRQPENHVFKKKPTDDFLEPFNFGNLLHPTPLLHLLNTPIRYINHMHKLRSHISPVVGTIPKVVRVSKRYIIDLMKHFGKNALQLGTNFVKGFTKITKPKVLPKLRHKRSVNQVENPESIENKRYAEEVDPKELDKFIEDLTKFFGNFGISLKVVEDFNIDGPFSNVTNFENSKESSSLKDWFEILRKSMDYELHEEINDAKEYSETNCDFQNKKLSEHQTEVPVNINAEYGDYRHFNRRKRESEKLYKDEQNDSSKSKRRIAIKKGNLQDDSFAADESTTFNKENRQKNKNYAAPKEVLQFLGKPEDPFLVFKKFLTDGDDPREFLNYESQRRRFRRKRDALSTLPYNSELWERILGLRNDKVANLKRRHTLRDEIPPSSASRISKTQNNLEVNVYHIQTIERKINDTNLKIKELFGVNLFNYLKIFQDIQKINYIKKNIIEQLENKLLEDTRLIAETNSIIALKNSVFKEIFRKLGSTDMFFKDTWMTILIKLQKLHCAIKNLNAKPNKFNLELLTKLTFHSFKNYQNLFIYLQNLQQKELDKEITFLENLHKILVEGNKDKIVKESNIIWEMNNIEKLQKVSVVELNEKMAGGKSIRRELKILFDLQKQFRYCEERQRALIEGTESSR